jgi:hypothetical protein
VSALWACPCGVLNPPRRRSCTHCGELRPRATKALADAETSAIRCAWLSGDASCRMLAVWWEQPFGNRDDRGRHVKPGWCDWHAFCRTTPRYADDFDEFERWQLRKIDRQYCDQFTHHPASYLWPALRGLNRPMSERRYVTPCASSSCWVPLALADHERAQRPCTPVENAGAMEIVQAVLAKKMTVKEAESHLAVIFQGRERP